VFIRCKIPIWLKVEMAPEKKDKKDEKVEKEEEKKTRKSSKEP